MQHTVSKMKHWLEMANTNILGHTRFVRFLINVDVYTDFLGCHK